MVCPTAPIIAAAPITTRAGFSLMIDERLLPNPFKQDAARNLDAVLEAIETELAENAAAPLPEFLDDAFLARFEADIMAPDNAASRYRGQRIVTALKSRLARRWR
jgi:hypothetical protein